MSTFGNQSTYKNQCIGYRTRYSLLGFRKRYDLIFYHEKKGSLYAGQFWRGDDGKLKVDEQAQQWVNEVRIQKNGASSYIFISPRDVIDDLIKKDGGYHIQFYEFQEKIDKLIDNGDFEYPLYKRNFSSKFFSFVENHPTSSIVIALLIERVLSGLIGWFVVSCGLDLCLLELIDLVKEVGEEVGDE